MATGSEDFTFALASGERAKDLTLQEWLSAWDKFSTVYLTKFPAEGINLIRYAAIIKDLATHKADWRQYDREFRQIRIGSRFSNRLGAAMSCNLQRKSCVE